MLRLVSISFAVCVYGEHCQPVSNSDFELNGVNMLSTLFCYSVEFSYCSDRWISYLQVCRQEALLLQRFCGMRLSVGNLAKHLIWKRLQSTNCIWPWCIYKITTWIKLVAYPTGHFQQTSTSLKIFQEAFREARTLCYIMLLNKAKKK